MSDIAKKLRDHMAGENQSEIASDAAIEATARVTAALLDSAREVEELEQPLPDDKWPEAMCFWSIGYTSQHFQLSPTEVRGLAKLSGVQFVAAFNGVPQYNALGILKMKKKLDELSTNKQAAKAN